MWSEPAPEVAIVVAHRGASAYEPENTLRAIRRAVALGAPAVEVDVRSTKDGALVLLHDETVNRTTDGSGSITALALEEIRELDAGKGERIPTLGEALDSLRGKATAVLELKERGLWPRVARLLGEDAGPREAIVVSFYPSEIGELKAAHPSIRTGVLFVGNPSDALAQVSRLGADLAGFRHETATTDLAGRLRRDRRRLLVWTVNDADRAREVAALGADFIVSDAPDVVLAAIGSP